MLESIISANLVLIDECVTSKLESFLKGKKLKAEVIAVSKTPELRGKKDDYLMELCYEYNTCLITRDVPFFYRYHGAKILFHNNYYWIEIFKDLRKYFNSTQCNYKYLFLN